MTAIDLLRMIIRGAKQFLGLAEHTLRGAEKRETAEKERRSKK